VEAGRAADPSAQAGRAADVREVLDAVFYVARTGCAWRMLPGGFPPWGTV
jgi:putative transposase